MSEESRGFWWTGSLRIANYVGNQLEGYSDPVDSLKLEITHDSQQEVISANRPEDAGEARDIISRRKPTKVVYSANAFGLRLLATAMLSSLDAFSQSSGSAVPFTVTLVKDLWVKLGKLNVSNVAITALALGTDFEVDAKWGLIRALTDTAVGSQTGTMTVGAATGKKIIGGKDVMLKQAFFMDVEDSSSGDKGLLEIYKVATNPSKAMAFLSTKPIEPEFSGFIIKQPGVSLYDFYPQIAFA